MLSEKKMTSSVMDVDNMSMDMSVNVSMDTSMEVEGGNLMAEELNKAVKPCMPSTEQFTRRQAEYFISNQICHLQAEDDKALPPNTLQEKINSMTMHNPDLAEAHFLTYLNCLRLNEFCGAVHSLHSYFDQLTQKFKENSTDDNNNTQEFQHNFRYAALNLASLHCRLGHRQEAVLALQEAIRKAQEVKDNVCLQHAMGWLYRLEREEDVNLDHTVNKSEEVNLPYLTSLGILNLAKQKGLSVVEPFKVFEYLNRSDALNCQYQQPQLVSTSLTQQAALWQVYGYRDMASLCAHLVLNISHPEVSAALNPLLDCESLVLALCHQAKAQFAVGNIEHAQKILNCAKEKFQVPSKHSQIWMMCDEQIAFQTAILQGKFKEAGKIIQSLAALSSNDATYRRCMLWTFQGRASDAVKTLSDGIHTAQQEKTTRELYAKNLLMLAAIYLHQSDPVSAIPHLLECITVCQQHHHGYLQVLAQAHIAYAQILMKMPHQALKLVEDILPHVLSNGSLYDECCLQLLLTECHCQVAADNADQRDARRPVYLSAVQQLTQIGEGFQAIGAEYKIRDVMYFQAHLYHELGYQSERNKCALQFRQLDQQYPSISPMQTPLAAHGLNPLLRSNVICKKRP